MVIDLITRLRHLLFPGYFDERTLDPANALYSVGQTVSALFNDLAEQIGLCIRHECLRRGWECTDCRERGYAKALELLQSVPELQRLLSGDVRAAYEGDPAARSFDEVIYSYPGVFAVMVYRVAHRLHLAEVPLLPRMMTEHAHGSTGIDIHPGASIGERFFIDHGTGVVIGETCQIGNDVRLYQGVTLGALSLQGSMDPLRHSKRHPTIGDRAIIYAGATILGGETVIGSDCVVGGNVWLTESVPQNTQVFLKKPELVYRQE
jgi:serine O-acetyltransferase